MIRLFIWLVSIFIVLINALTFFAVQQGRDVNLTVPLVVSLAMCAVLLLLLEADRVNKEIEEENRL